VVGDSTGEHLLRDRGSRSLQVREAEHLAADEMKENRQLPAPLENLKSLLDTLRRLLSALYAGYLSVRTLLSCVFLSFGESISTLESMQQGAQVIACCSVIEGENPYVYRSSGTHSSLYYCRERA
jgi:hypothetical protein